MTWAVVALAAVCAGCSRTPADLAVPPQVTYSAASGHFIAMNSPAAPNHIVGGIAELVDGRYRWTTDHPELKLWLPRTDGLTLMADYFVSDYTFPQTGPVTVTVLVNGKALDKTRYDKTGEMHWSKPAPPEMLRVGENRVEFAQDRVHRDPDGKRVLGLILMRAGFID